MCVDEATSRRADSAGVQPRRGVLKWMGRAAAGVGFAALAATHGLWAAMTARFLVPNVAAEPSRRLKAGPAEYRDGLVETKFAQKYGVWIVHGTYRGARQIVALRTACTHLGCIVRGRPASRRFNARATAAVSRAKGSTWPARHRARWNAARSASPTTGSWRSTAAAYSGRNSGSGKIGRVRGGVSGSDSWVSCRLAVVGWQLAVGMATRHGTHTTYTTYE